MLPELAPVLSFSLRVSPPIIIPTADMDISTNV